MKAWERVGSGVQWGRGGRGTSVILSTIKSNFKKEMETELLLQRAVE